MTRTRYDTVPQSGQAAAHLLTTSTRNADCAFETEVTLRSDDGAQVADALIWSAECKPAVTQATCYKLAPRLNQNPKLALSRFAWVASSGDGQHARTKEIGSGAIMLGAFHCRQLVDPAPRRIMPPFLSSRNVHYVDVPDEDLLETGGVPGGLSASRRRARHRASSNPCRAGCRGTAWQIAEERRTRVARFASRCRTKSLRCSGRRARFGAAPSGIARYRPC